MISMNSRNRSKPIELLAVDRELVENFAGRLFSRKGRQSKC
jgi:hypothetical protein